ncbi:MAG TPA: N-acetylneuraminate synthase family protein [Candidatus Nanoarchaeia archaeon]|nr:N-acetylneuraminate synthase family protein [Candidatus Nanoarchaeia archaeon]
MQFQVGSRTVGGANPCFIVAEAGVNHNGDLSLAKQLIEAAAKAKVDAVKFQLLKADSLYVKDAGTWKTDFNEEFDIHGVWKKTEMPLSWISELKEYADEKNLIFFSSVFDEQGADFINPYVGIYKIASSELSHIPLLKHVAKKKKPIIISIGGATMAEVQEAITVVKETGNNAIALLYCVPIYPTPLDKANVKALETLRKKFPDIVVGYSDHSLDPVAVPRAAISYGAKIIEKHFTLSKAMLGIDHKMSLEPKELNAMVSEIRKAEADLTHGTLVINSKAIGDGIIHPGDAKMSFLRRKIFAIQTILKGQQLTKNNIAVLRPGNRDVTNGLHPSQFEALLGKKASRDISALKVMTKEDVE